MALTDAEFELMISIKAKLKRYYDVNISDKEEVISIDNEDRWLDIYDVQDIYLLMQNYFTLKKKQTAN